MRRGQVSEKEHDIMTHKERKQFLSGLVSDEPRPVTEPSGLELLHETIQTEIDTLGDVFIAPVGSEIPELLQ